jgi:hypothetical protein
MNITVLITICGFHGGEYEDGCLLGWLALADWFLYLKPIPHTWLTHCPDDGGSKDL